MYRKSASIPSRGEGSQATASPSTKRYKPLLCRPRAPGYTHGAPPVVAACYRLRRARVREDCSAADLFAVVASIVLLDDAVSTGFCGVTCASSVRAVSLPTCSLLCVLDGSELCSGWVLPAFVLYTCASLVRPAADHGFRAGFRATAAVLLGFASSVVAHPVLGALFPAFSVHSYCSRASRYLSGYLLL